MYQKEVKAPGFKVESFVSGHEVLRCVNYDARYTSVKLKCMRQACNWFPGVQRKLKVYHQGGSTEHVKNQQYFSQLA